MNPPAKVVRSGFSLREETALRHHIETKEPTLSPSLQAELFNLYLNGLSCEDILRHNKALRLGSIVRAAHDGDWFERREDYLNSLLGGVRDRAQQAQAQSVNFVSNGLAALEKLYSAKILRYLQTGNEADLGDIANWGMHQYKQLIEMFLKLTGQDGAKSLTVKTRVEKEAHLDTATEKAGPIQQQQGPATAVDAATLLELLEKLR